MEFSLENNAYNFQNILALGWFLVLQGLFFFIILLNKI
jgi:hypothetical protein